MKLLDLGEDMWVPYLIGALPSDVTSLIVREPEEKCRDYSHNRGMFLQWFKLTAEIFRELFSRHRKSPNGTWKDYYFEIRKYFEGWLNELKIDLFHGLKNLMIADQMKNKCSPEWTPFPGNHISLADGQQTTGEVLTTQVMIEIEGRSVLTKFIILPKAKGNRTLQGPYFLSSAGLVLDVKNTCCYFWDNPTHKYPFGEELDSRSIVEKMSSNTCQLREGEG
ncbi:uncharacterized protein TNCV_2731131 [Trichonephila clavipes]|nr:uncharacterized protein TNCV_2731131 [Trichonephila clavipes]